KIASKPLRGKAGERSDRIVARDPPVKGPPGRVDIGSPPRRAPAQTPSRGDATSPHPPALRCTSAPSRHSERTRSARHVRAGDNGEAQSGATEEYHARGETTSFRSAAARHPSERRSAHRGP